MSLLIVIQPERLGLNSTSAPLRLEISFNDLCQSLAVSFLKFINPKIKL